MSAAARTLRQVIPRTIPTSLPTSFPSQFERARLLQDIEHLASRSGTPLTLRELYDFGKRAKASPRTTRIHSAQFLHSELPIRLAHRARELSELPYGLARMPSVIKVRDMYEESFQQLRQTILPKTMDEEHDFSSLLSDIHKKHQSVQILIAKGIIELKEYNGRWTNNLIEVKEFLDRFYMSRIGIRVLINHHLLLGNNSEKDKNMAGIINTKCQPINIIETCSNIVQSLSYQHYGDSTKVQIHGNTDLTFPYVDSHLQLCLIELLKNSLRATIETHKDATNLPPVRVIVADGVEDITIKISDQGGGFRRSELNKVWSYLFTTAKLPAAELLKREDDRRSNAVNRPDPIAGFGYGLPLSRLYARYWGGELALTSMEGYGTDAYLHLSKLGDKKECLSALKGV